MAHVGDVDLQRIVAVVEALHPDRVIKIARCFAVDRDDIERPEIAAPRDLAGGDRTGNGLRLLQHVFRKTVRDVMRADHNLNVDAEIIGVTQNLDDPANRPVAVAAVVENLRRDDKAFEIFSGMRFQGRRAHTVHARTALGDRETVRNSNPLPNPFVMRNHVITAAARAEFADHRWMRAAQDLHDVAMRAAVGIDARDPGDHTIAVHRACGVFL